MSEVTLGVVIPTFNGRTVVLDALDSLAAQTRPPDEVIVVDDGSSDGTPELVRAHALAPRVYCQPENRGVAAARNRGLLQLQTTHAALLDQDDLWYPDRVATVVEHLRANPEHGLVVSDATAFAVTSERASLTTHPFRSWISEWVEAPTQLLSKSRERPGGATAVEPLGVRGILDDSVSITCSHVFDRKLALEAGGFATWLRSADDWVALATMARFTEAVRIRQPSVWYRVHGSNTSLSTDWRLALLTAKAALQHGNNLLSRSDPAPPAARSRFWCDLLDRLATSADTEALATALACAQLISSDGADVRSLRRRVLRRWAGATFRRATRSPRRSE